MGAVAIYLLLGMMFAFLPCHRVEWEVRSSADRRGHERELPFLQFHHIDPTGCGNLGAAGNPGQSVAVLEAIVRQLFLVTALARSSVPGVCRPRNKPATDPSA